MAQGQNPEMNHADLYREETFTDRHVGAIRRFTPVDANGNDDPSRPSYYVGEAQVMTAGGPMPLHFEIQASSLEDAAKQFSAEANKAIERTMRELEEMRRERASSIVLPGQGGGAGGGGIQLP